MREVDASAGRGCGWSHRTRPRHANVMIGVTEYLIIAVGFALPSLYLVFVNRYIRMAERETAEAEAHDRRDVRQAA